MHTVSFGDALEVTCLAMGTDKLEGLSDKDFFSLLDQYFDAGGNCIDTARLYGAGKCEEMVGRYIRRFGRGRMVLITKGAHPPMEDMHTSRLSQADLEHDVNASLRALGTDVIDMYFVHRDDVSKPVEEILHALNSMRDAGKIRFFGCSNWSVERIAKANEYARSAGLRGFVASQIQWSLAQTHEDIYDAVDVAIMNDAAYEWYLRQRMPVFAYASQAQGFFYRMIEGEGIRDKVRARFASPDNIRRMANVMDYARKHHVSASVPVLGYITCNPLPAIAIIGPKNQAQLLDSLAAADVALSPEEVEALARV